jgi:hypothetical protein
MNLISFWDMISPMPASVYFESCQDHFDFPITLFSVSFSVFIYIYIYRYTKNDKKVMIWSMDQKKSWFLGIFELRNNHLKVRIQLFSYLSGLHVLYTLQLKLKKKKIDYKKISGNTKLFIIIIKSKSIN